MNYIKTIFDLWQLKRNEKKSVEEISSLQTKKLKRLLHYAYEHSVYYRSSFERAGITAEMIDSTPLSSFPTMDKSVLMSQFEEIVTVSDLTQEEVRGFDEKKTTDQKLFKGKYHIVHSSGSTGTPKYFVYDEGAWNSMLPGIVRGALWNMTMPEIIKFLIHGPRIVYIAATNGRYGGSMAVGDGVNGVGAKQIYLDINTPLDEWISAIKEFKPNMIIGYPSAVKILAELVEKGDLDLKVLRIVTCGEPLGAGLRKYIGGVFGASESLSLGVESSPKEGMLLFDDMNIIEIQDGVMYLTCLYNFVQPLIRYRLSDQLILKAPNAESRYPFTCAVGLLGRNEDILWFQDGNGKQEFLHPLAVEGLCIEGLRDYQFRQISPDTFEMLAEASNDLQKTVQDEVLRQMRNILIGKGLDYVQFFVRFVPEILPDPKTGQKRLILTDMEAA